MSGTYCFSVHAEASPSTLPRVVEVFALHGHVPCRCHAQLAGRDELVVDLQMADVTADEAALLAKRLGRVVTVRNVLWSEKRGAAAA
jgi:acetolactate synthase regulatory subunit